MWSDLLYLAERAHLGRMIAWGSVSLLAGTVIVLLVVARRRGESPLLLNFALVTGAWGLVCLAIGAVGLQSLEMRDLDAFTRYDRVLWLSVGLDIGVIAAGLALAGAGWMAGRSLKLLGAGAATTAQGLALLVLHSTAISTIMKLMAPA